MQRIVEELNLELCYVTITINGSGDIFHPGNGSNGLFIMSALRDMIHRDSTARLKPAIELLAHDYSYPEGQTTAQVDFAFNLECMQFSFDIEATIARQLDPTNLGAVITAALVPSIFSEFLQYVTALRQEGSLCVSDLIDLTIPRQPLPALTSV